MTDETTHIMPDNPELIVLGQEAQDFKNSVFGRYMFDRAAEQAGEAAKMLCEVDPEDSKAIRELQTKARRLKDLNNWVNELVFAAQNEYNNYQQKLTEGE